MPSADLFVESAAKTTVIMLVAWAATRLWHDRASAAIRGLVWTAAVVSILIVPLLVAFSPRWRIDALPADWTAWFSTGPTFTPTDPKKSSRLEHPVAVPTPDDVARGASIVDPDSLFPSAPVSVDAPRRLEGLLLLFWLLGMSLGTLRVMAGLAWAAWIVRRAVRLEADEWRSDAVEAAARMKVDGPVPVLLTDKTGVPATCGIFHPVLLLPPEAVVWRSDRRRAVLLHELAHVRRRDCVVRVIAELAVAVHWFNPLAWLVAARLRAEQERACDDLVLAAGMNGPEYAEHLCEIAHESRSMAFPGWAALAMARPSHLASRVNAILDARRSRRRPSRGATALTLAGTSAAVVALGAFELAAREVMAPTMARDESVATRSMPERSGADAAVGSASAALPVQGRIVDRGDEPRTFLNEYCTTCHSASRRTANLALDSLNFDDLSATGETWERVVRKVRSGLHPPAGVARPDVVRSNAFLAFVETALDRADQANWGPDGAAPLTGDQLAQRLARFLWGGVPDSELRRLAARGRLTDPAELQRQARRMLADPLAAAWRRGFFGQWLDLGNVDRVKPDPSLFPSFDDGLREAFRRETELFVDSQVREDRSVPELLTANYTFVNARLARHYGIPNVTGSEFRRVSVNDEARAGLLGQASILTVTSYATRTSPVLRGKFVLEMFLGTPPPPPPANVPALKDSDPQHPQPLRRRMEESVKAPVCASCHSLMDPIGFSLENFDAIGQWRDTDAGLPIDASGTLSDDTTFSGPAGFRIALVQRSDVLVRTIAERLLAYALAGDVKLTGVRRFHMPAVRAAVAEAALDNYRWSALVAGIVSSTPFRMHRLK